MCIWEGVAATVLCCICREMSDRQGALGATQYESHFTAMVLEVRLK